MEAKHNEQIKKINTLNDKVKACDSTIRSLDNDVQVIRNEQKAVVKLMNESRDAQNSIFQRAVDDFESK